MYSDDFLYTKDHEWVRVENGDATVGITNHAQHELGDIVFVELPDIGKTLEVGEKLATVESVKAVSDVYSPVGGEVLQVNDVLTEKPELVNQDPHGEGWIAKLRLADRKDLEGLMSADEYETYLAEVEKS
ncbi:MAG: glycine cleavage system protein GcvH [Acidobacteria bacterium]|nr:glycine cleavage system protein GcvH [Acidobacteriota bacterium]